MMRVMKMIILRASFGKTCKKCGTWSLILREEHRLWVFENRLLRRIFELKRDEMIGGWRQLHNEERHNLYYSPSTGCSIVEET
jgi:hypothetical protein